MPKYLESSMARVAPLKVLPANLGHYIEEIAAGLEHLYGPAAEKDYRLRARRSFASSLAHPAVEAYGASLGGEIAGIIMGFRRGAVGEISLLHVLRPFCGKGLEALLVQALAGSLQRSSVQTILFECLSLCTLDVAASFDEIGFTRIERELMLARLDTPGLQYDGTLHSVTCTPEHWEELAECIVDAYVGHPEQRLHYEVNSVSGTLDFIARVAAGNYGPSHPDMIRMIPDKTGCIGGILGCPIAPETGFTLQVVVRREEQGQGHGRKLLQELAQVFREYGMRDMGLGVTSASPARHLYISAGFKSILPVDAYVWWRN